MKNMTNRKKLYSDEWGTVFGSKNPRSICLSVKYLDLPESEIAFPKEAIPEIIEWLNKQKNKDEAHG